MEATKVLHFNTWQEFLNGLSYYGGQKLVKDSYTVEENKDYVIVIENLEEEKRLELSYRKLIQQLQEKNDIIHREVRQHNQALENQDKLIKILQQDVKNRDTLINEFTKDCRRLESEILDYQATLIRVRAELKTVKENR